MHTIKKKNSIEEKACNRGIWHPRTGDPTSGTPKEDGQDGQQVGHVQYIPLLPFCDAQQFTKVPNQHQVQTTSHQELTRYKPQGKKSNTTASPS